MKKPDRSVPIPESDPASAATAVVEAGEEAERSRRGRLSA